MSTIKYNRYWACANNGTAPVAASTSEIPTKKGFARQEQQPDKVTGNWQPAKSRIGRGRPFTPSQIWKVQDGVATCTVEPGFIATVDAADLPIVDGHRWFIKQSGKNLYASTGQGFFMHRMVVGCQKKDGKRVDHQDCDGLNCRRYNLRITNQSGNRANSRKHSGGYKGVFKRKGQKRFCAGISKTIDGKQLRFHLGMFDTKEEAARAYDRKAVELFGEFARLNFPAAAQEQAA